MANQFIARHGLITKNSVIISGSLAVTGSGISLNGIEVVLSNQTSSLTALSSSFATTASLAQTASFVTLAQSASYVLNAQSASYVANAQTASYVENAQTASYVTLAQTASYVQNAQSASYVLNAISASNAATASSADNLTVRGTLTAQTIVAQTITSSIEFITGSTRNGSLSSNTHQFTGSVGITGSLAINGTGAIVGSGTANYVPKFTASDTIGNSQIQEVSGNVGIGVAPSSWGASFKSIQVGTTGFLSSGVGVSNFGHNYYFDGTNPIYLTTTNASLYQQTGGQHIWLTAPSGTAGNAITFTQAMTLTAAGFVGIGTTSPTTKLTVYGGYANFTDGTVDIYAGSDGSGGLFGTISNQYQRFITNNTERMRITSAGIVLIGKTTSTGGILQVSNGTNMFNVDYDANGPYITAVNNANTVYKRLTYDASEHIFATSATERMRITSAGNVGIGATSITASTNYKMLKISGTSGAEFTLGTTSTDVGYIYANTGDFVISALTAVPLTFQTNSTTRMTITSGGILCMGTTAVIINEERLSLSGTGNTATIRTTTAGNSCILLWNSATSGNNSFLEFGTDATFAVRGSITYNRGSAVVAYNTTSDYRLKSEINDFNALEIISNLKPKEFRIGDAINKSLGFIAHELQEYLPQAVQGEKDAVNEDGKPIYQSVDYSQLTGLLTKAIQELSAKVSLLENK